MNKQIYLIGDVHGCYDTLIALIAQLPENAKIIFCGDLIDRGPKSKQVINFVRENGHYCVMGNHEDMMIQFCESSYNSSYWFKNGGRACFNNYDNEITIVCCPMFRRE
jgi:serine/threonine protein phosphatase 1